MFCCPNFNTSVRPVCQPVVVVSGAYTGFIELRINVTAWKQERPHARIREGLDGLEGPEG